MLTFLRARLPIISALVLTLSAFYALLSRQSFDAAWMLRWNQVDSVQVQFMLGLLLFVFLLALPFAPRIQVVLRRGRVVVFVLAAVASFLSIRLLEPLEEHRLFVTPFSIWIIIIWVVSLAGLAVWTASKPKNGDEQMWFAGWIAKGDRLLVGLYCFVIVILIGLHIASVGEFLTIDTPDEPWLASMATNYAENNDLSPTFIGSSYGSPDPILPRYYLLMGLWLRPAGSSLAALRITPLLALAVVIVIMAALLWRDATFTRLQRLGAIVVLLSLSALIRMSHNLRADIGLAIYGAVMVWALLQFFDDTSQRKRWAIISGLALYIGLETIPFIALILAAVAGLILIIWLLHHRKLRYDWQPVVIYALCCGAALAVYVAVRFLPDLQAQLGGYRRFNAVYSGQTGLGTLRFPIDTLINYHVRFSLILSPVELITIIAALILCWRWGTSAQRWLLMTFALALVIMQIVTGFTYGYWTLFVPLVAYAAACALRSHRTILIGSLVLVPALVAVPYFDMMTAIQTRPNQTYLSSLDQLTPQIPSGSTIVGESAFWFTLHTHRKFIGIDGFWVYASGHPNQTISDNIENLGVDVLLCSKDNKACDEIIATGLFASPVAYDIDHSTYLIYWRKNR